MTAKIKNTKMIEWPESWKGVPEDVAYGKEIVKLFQPFIEALIAKALSAATINRHIDHLWMLGGWLISHLNHQPEDRRKPAMFLIAEHVDSMEGPNIRDLDEAQQEKFGATCRLFYRWLVENRLKKACGSKKFVLT